MAYVVHVVSAYQSSENEQACFFRTVFEFSNKDNFFFLIFFSVQKPDSYDNLTISLDTPPPKKNLTNNELKFVRNVTK